MTFSVPTGWRVVDAPANMKLDYQIAVAALHKGSMPNIVITDETFSGTTDQYADFSVRHMSKSIPESKFIDKSKFQTKGGISGTKVVMRNTVQGQALRQVFYLFPTKTGLILTFTVSSPVEQGLKYDKAMDAAMRDLILKK